MVDGLVENLKVETEKWWTDKKVNAYDTNKTSEIGKVETQQARQEAEDLLKKIQADTTVETTKSTQKEQTPQINSQTKIAIDALNRPEASAGIQKAYTAVENTIKNSKTETGIAGFLGKIMNKILWQ